MRLYGALQASGSALTAQRLRMDLVTENLANLNTTRTAAGGPYRRKVAVLAERAPSFGEALSRAAGGVGVSAITEDPSPPKRKYDPGHPDAGPDGWVDLPNVDVAQEIIELMAARGAYDANVTAFNAAKAMAMKALEIGR